MTTTADLLLLVEGPSDAEIVRLIFQAAHLPAERVRVMVLGGKRSIQAACRDLGVQEAGRYAVLVDLDELGVHDALASAREQLGHPIVEVFCEAWLFADDRSALSRATSVEARSILEKLPLPEAIPNPGQLARELFGPQPGWDFLRDIDIGYAAARSPSLRSFLVGIGKLLHIEQEVIAESVGRTIDRDVIATLISEVLPSDTVVWRTTSGEYTAAPLRQHIQRMGLVGCVSAILAARPGGGTCRSGS